MCQCVLCKYILTLENCQGVLFVKQNRQIELFFIASKMLEWKCATSKVDIINIMRISWSDSLLLLLFSLIKNDFNFFAEEGTHVLWQASLWIVRQIKYSDAMGLKQERGHLANFAQTPTIYVPGGRGRASDWFSKT